jgi:large subunit ribosomal protein L21
MTYAVIEMGGKQYRVEKGDSVVVDRIDAKEGAKVSARPILYAAGDKTVMDGPDLAKVKVDAVVTEHLKGEKIRVFKYRPKKRYRRTIGHRSLLTRLEISDIRLGAARAKAEPAKDAEAKPKAEAAKPKTEAAKPKTEAKPKTAAAKPKAGAAKPKAETAKAKPAAAKAKPAASKAKPGAAKKKPAPKKTGDS